MAREAGVTQPLGFPTRSGPNAQSSGGDSGVNGCAKDRDPPPALPPPPPPSSAEEADAAQV